MPNAAKSPQLFFLIRNPEHRQVIAAVRADIYFGVQKTWSVAPGGLLVSNDANDG